MKIALTVLFLGASAFAQSQPAAVTDACGPKDVTFDVKQDNSQHALVQPEVGKARVYIIQQNNAICFLVGCITKIGMDGAWVGAFKANSWFSVSVDPGEHHACVTVQGISGLGDQKVYTHFIAEAGKVYYLGTRAMQTGGYIGLDFGTIDSDEAKYLIATFPRSVSQPKK
jgi:hypothetical protein